jgi:hypothetical protein
MRLVLRDILRSDDDVDCTAQIRLVEDRLDPLPELARHDP